MYLYDSEDYEGVSYNCIVYMDLAKKNTHNSRYFEVKDHKIFFPVEKLL